MRIALAGLVTALGVAACATSNVTPVAKLETKQICIIENPKVRSTFLDAYRKALEERGFQVQLFPETAPADACPLTSKYVAFFWWDMVFYMRQAQIDVYSEGKSAGRAFFDAQGSRFFSTEEKVKELVDRLFPR